MNLGRIINTFFFFLRNYMKEGGAAYSRKLRITISRVILQSIYGCVRMCVAIIMHMLNTIKIYKYLRKKKFYARIYSKC